MGTIKLSSMYHGWEQVFNCGWLGIRAVVTEVESYLSVLWRIPLTYSRFGIGAKVFQHGMDGSGSS